MEAVLHDFYLQLKQGKIMGRQCRICGDISFPPRGICKCCGSESAQWVEMCGKGKLLYASAGPNLLLGNQYVMATVQLQEGPIIAGALLDDSFDYAHPETILDYNCNDLAVNVKVCANLAGGVIVAFKKSWINKPTDI